MRDSDGRRLLRTAGTATTFMEPHGVPSGGDWALQRTAALFFEGTEGCAIDGCVLQRLDGNAVMLSGYNQVPPKPHLPHEKTLLMHASAGVAH